MNSKCAGSNMVSDSAYPAAVVVVGYVFLLTGFSDSFNDGQKNIDMEVAVDPLKHRACALQPHSCVYVPAWKWSKVIGWIADSVMLREYQIPNFNFAAVWHSVENFTAGPADAIRASGRSTCRPEIIIFTHSCDTG